MIHDCSSFIAEYMYTGHPVLFTLKDGCEYKLNSEDKVVFNAMYHGSDLTDIDSFIAHVVLEGVDEKKEERKKVLLNQLSFVPGTEVCERIYNELVELVS